MAENDETLMTNDEGMCKPERTSGKRGHPERSRRISRWKLKLSPRDPSISLGMTAQIIF